MVVLDRPGNAELSEEDRKEFTVISSFTDLPLESAKSAETENGAEKEEKATESTKVDAETEKEAVETETAAAAETENGAEAENGASKRKIDETAQDDEAQVYPNKR